MATHAYSTGTPVLFLFDSAEIRVIRKGGQFWFYADEICAVLGFESPAKAISNFLDDDEHEALSVPASRIGAFDKPAGEIISLSAVHALIMCSERKATARYFSKWISSRVLPNAYSQQFAIPHQVGKYAYATVPMHICMRLRDLCDGAGDLADWYINHADALAGLDEKARQSLDMLVGGIAIDARAAGSWVGVYDLGAVV